MGVRLGPNAWRREHNRNILVFPAPCTHNPKMTDEAAESPPGQGLIEALNQTGLPQTVKGKFQRLILRLIMGGPGFEYYAKAREKLDEVEGRSRINAIVADEIGRQALMDPEFMERAKARLLGDMVQRQENVEAVAARAKAKMDAMPEGEATAEASGPEPSQDWVNSFTREAELASSDELRERLAEVLAGEARKPGTYSRATVRFIAEAERDTLDAFGKALQHRVSDAIIRDPKEWNSGAWFNIGTILEAEGLISGATGFTHKTMTLDDNGNGFFIGDRAGLVCKGPVGITLNISVWLLTRLGSQVATLMTATDEFAALARLSAFIDKSQLTSIVSGPVLRLPTFPKGGIQIPTVFVLWDAEAEQLDEKVDP